MVACDRCGTESPEGFRFCPGCGAPLSPALPPRQSRKVVTALFCDVTGSTALGEELDPEVLRGVLNRYFAEIRAIIERHGGTVEKFIGDAVMAVFGIPKLHEDDALRAVRAAAEIRDRLPAIAQEVGVKLRFRTGVNTGPVLVGEGENLAVGDAVNVAARLEQTAQPGEIVLGEETVALVRDAVEVEALEPLALKGKSGPVAGFRLVSVDPSSEGFARNMDTPLVGRQEELAVLRRTWDTTLKDSSCHLLTVLGEAGVGKSRLVGELLAVVGDEATVLRGRCLHYGEGITFWPLVEALMLAGESARQVLDGLSSGTLTTPGELFWGVRRVLEGLAVQRPVVLHIDDLQWGETLLLDLIDYLADLSRAGPILLLCTARPELLDTRPAWGAGKENAARLRLQPLTAEAALTLLDELGDGLGPEATARVIEASDGNPLFLEEMAALARERGTVETPGTIQALLTARLERLDAKERELLERGAVEGEVFHRLGVRALADERLATEVELRLAGLVRKELIRPHPATFQGDEAFRFRHLLIRDAAYDGLPKSIRAELHERFARWLESVGSDLVERDEIAGWHLEQSVRYRRELGRGIDNELARSASTHLHAAGDRAFARGDMPAAANLLGRALELLPEGDSGRPELMVDLAGALSELGQFGQAISMCELALAEAQRVGSERGMWRARVALALVKPQLGASFGESALVAEEAAAALSGCGDALGVARAWNVVALARLQTGRMTDAETAFGNAIEHARRAHSVRDEAHALDWLAVSAWAGPTPVEQGISRCRELAAHAPTRQVEAFALLEEAPLVAMRGEFDEARSLYRHARGLLEELGLNLYAAGASQECYDIELLAGDLDAAEAELRRACATLELLGEKGFLSTRAALLAHVLCLQGRVEEAEPFLELAAGCTGPDDLLSQGLVRSIRALIMASRGQAEAAVALAHEAAALLEPTEWPMAHGDALFVLGEVLRAAGRGPEAVVALERALERYDQKGNVVASNRTKGMLDDLRVALKRGNERDPEAP